jgi:hypothetical protein
MKTKMTEREAIRRYKCYERPPGGRCVICKKKGSDFRFGVCEPCSSENRVIVVEKRGNESKVLPLSFRSGR